MDLNQYLRMMINDKVRPLFIKEKCEVCGDSNKLHLHHVKLFRDIIKETLADLNLEYKDSNEYSDREIDMIVNIVLGKHLRIDYLTLCDECHKNTHKDDWKEVCVNDKHEAHYERLRQKKELERKIYMTETLTEHFKVNLGKEMLERKDREELIKLINARQNGRLLKSLEMLNNELEKYSIPFKIRKFETKRKIGEGEYKRYKNVWKLEAV